MGECKYTFLMPLYCNPPSPFQCCDWILFYAVFPFESEYDRNPILLNCNFSSVLVNDEKMVVVLFA
jgi:hypothetical protein